MKKLTSLLLVVALSIFMAACGSQKQADNNETSNSLAETEPAETTEEERVVTEEEATDESEVLTEPESSVEEIENETTSATVNNAALVVYFSATGSTKAVANYIADAIGADLFELEPVEPYTDEDLNWSNDDSRVSREHDDESLRDVELVSTTVDNFSDYDEILIGYPIWWGIAAWPVNQFIKNNDFTGKTVIPFCTSASSGLGDSGKLLEEMAGTGNWQEGQRFSSGASESEVQDWAKSLN